MYVWTYGCLCIYQDVVLPHTRRWAKHFGVEARASYLEGSAFDVALPDAGFDVIIVSQARPRPHTHPGTA